MFAHCTAAVTTAKGRRLTLRVEGASYVMEGSHLGARILEVAATSMPALFLQWSLYVAACSVREPSLTLV